MLWVKEDESLLPFLPKGRLFDSVIVINALNKGSKRKRKELGYLWIFKVAGPVLRRGGTLQLVGGKEDHESIVWAMTHLDTIKRAGFIVPPAFAPPTMEADQDLQSLPSFRMVETKDGEEMLPISSQQQQAVQIFFERRG